MPESAQPTKVEYTKPHTTLEEQVRTLEERGLVCADPVAAKALLSTTGYYRLSAYIYPFRQLLAQDLRTSPWNFRSEVIEPGTTLELVRDLWRFDRGLRLVVLDAVETIEVGMKSRIAYVLGRRNKFGHLDPMSLDMQAAYRKVKGQFTAHDLWLEEYASHVGRAKEDYVRHNNHKYLRLPVWIGMEPQSFGNVVDLFRMMRAEDQDEIATSFGVGRGKVLGDWITAIRYLRNEAAHHARIWNRERYFKIQKPLPSDIGSDLHHLLELPSGTNKKIYATLAVAAHLVREADPESKFFGAFATRLSKFPIATGFSPEGDMGFPADWKRLDVWRH